MHNQHCLDYYLHMQEEAGDVCDLDHQTMWQDFWFDEQESVAKF